MYVSHIVNNYTISQLKDIPKFTDVWSSANTIRSVVTFVSIRYLVTLLINLKQFIHNKWLMDSLISSVYCNDSTKYTCLIPVLDQHLFIFSRAWKRTWSKWSRL